MREKYVKQQPMGYIDLTSDVFFKRYFAKNDPVLFSLMKSFLWISDEASSLLLTNPTYYRPHLAIYSLGKTPLFRQIYWAVNRLC